MAARRKLNLRSSSTLTATVAAATAERMKIGVIRAVAAAALGVEEDGI